MAGVRRRLRDVSSKVSGAFGVRPPEEDVSPVSAEGEAEPGFDDVEPEPAQAEQAPPAPAAEEADVHVEQAPPVDEVLAAAVDLARAAAVEVAGDAVGAHLGAAPDGPVEEGPAVVHRFATTDRAYVGWHWAVTVARAESAQEVTVDEVVLLPGEGALLAPAWVPWSERVEAGDLSPGDLLPAKDDDPRLVPAYASDDDDQQDLARELWWDLGLGREHVLSREGRLDAAERWDEGETGPTGPHARSAPGTCGDCGFLVPLTGALRQSYGACANEQTPFDGRVVSLAHGCGGFSETSVDSAHASTAGMAVEDDEFELVPTGAGDQEET